MGTKKTKTKKTKKQKTKQKNLCLYIVIFQSGFDVQGHNQEYVVSETMWSAGEIAAHKKKKKSSASEPTWGHHLTTVIILWERAEVSAQASEEMWTSGKAMANVVAIF